MSEPARTIPVLHELQAAGVRLSVDDFGTGYSSLSYLQRLPITEVKIDKLFVAGLANADSASEAIVGAVTVLGHTLKLDVVAEGVEDADTWNRLAAVGCDLAQGYHLSPPVPAAENPQARRTQPARPAAPRRAPADPGPETRIGAGLRGAPLGLAGRFDPARGGMIHDRRRSACGGADLTGGRPRD